MLKNIQNAQDQNFSMNVDVDVHDADGSPESNNFCFYKTKYISNTYNDDIINTRDMPDKELYLLNFYETCKKKARSGLSVEMYNQRNYVLQRRPRNNTTVYDNINDFIQEHDYYLHREHFLTYVDLQFKNVSKSKNLFIGNKFYDFLNNNNLLSDVFDEFLTLPPETVKEFNKQSLNASLFSDYSGILNDYEDRKKSEKDYYEIFGYRIQKFRQGSTSPIRTWIFPNTDKDILNWIDTEVMYNEPYDYSIDLLLCIMGRKNSSDTALLYILNSKRINGVTLYKSCAPISPEVSIIPYVGIDNKILLLASGRVNVDGYIKEPIIISSAENEIYSKIRESSLKQNELKQDQPGIFFCSIKEEKKFIAYRLENAPKSWADFNDSIKMEFENFLIDNTIQKNKKYYYTFRTIDDFGAYSLPSDIFSVELVNDSGVIYPVIQTYNFIDQSVLTDFMKKFRNKISISPAPVNLIYKSGMGDLIDKVGNSSNLCWDKKFKIRITSISSAKKVDFMLKFTKTQAG